jgi:hypothetical protein
MLQAPGAAHGDLVLFGNHVEHGEAYVGEGAPHVAVHFEIGIQSADRFR